MCRHLAWLGGAVDLAALLLDPPHSLLRQSYAPADMRGGGTINADGFGAGWYPAHDHPAHDHPPHDGEPAAPVRYRNAVPIWTDTSFAALARTVRSSAVLAAVRSATVGMPVTHTACAPFTAGRWLFSHNGMVAGWPHSLAGLVARLPVTDLLTLDAPTDSAVLWALVRHRLAAGRTPGSALAGVVTEVLAAAPGSRLNLLIIDGTTIAATAVYHALWVRTGPAGVLVSSEPTDRAPGWRSVPEGHLLTATPSGVDIVPISPPTSAEEP